MRTLRVLLVVATAGSLLGCQPASPERLATEVRACAPSPLGRVSVAGPIQTLVRFGDRLAGPAEIDHRDGSKGQVWLLRSDDPPLIVRVHAEQADGPGRSAFDLVRATTTRPPGVWPSGAAAFVYMPGDLGRILPTAGCWKFWLTNRADDVVTLPVR